jgi:hypothetical protein
MTKTKLFLANVTIQKATESEAYFDCCVEDWANEQRKAKQSTGSKWQENVRFVLIFKS